MLGAGGGLEMKVFAEHRPGWRFVGVDPAGEMLKGIGKKGRPIVKEIPLPETPKKLKVDSASSMSN